MVGDVLSGWLGLGTFLSLLRPGSAWAGPGSAGWRGHCSGCCRSPWTRFQTGLRDVTKVHNYNLLPAGEPGLKYCWERVEKRLEGGCERSRENVQLLPKLGVFRRRWGSSAKLYLPLVPRHRLSLSCRQNGTCPIPASPCPLPLHLERPFGDYEDSLQETLWSPGSFCSSELLRGAWVMFTQ